VGFGFGDLSGKRGAMDSVAVGGKIDTRPRANAPRRFANKRGGADVLLSLSMTIRQLPLSVAWLPTMKKRRGSFLPVRPHVDEPKLKNPPHEGRVHSNLLAAFVHILRHLEMMLESGQRLASPILRTRAPAVNPDAAYRGPCRGLRTSRPDRSSIVAGRVFSEF
jgi:hypothetical protein